MAEKTVSGEITENYVVKAHSEGFTYTMDFAERTQNALTQGTSPTGLLLSALAGCHLMTARSYLDARHILFNQLKVVIDGDFVNGKTSWTLDAQVTLKTDAQLDNQQLNALEKFIMRHCTVSSILQHGNQIKCLTELLR